MATSSEANPLPTHPQSSPTATTKPPVSAVKPTQLDILRKLVTDNGFTIDSKEIDCDPCGIGDLLLACLGIQQGLIKRQMVFNFNMIMKYHPKPSNSLEFKMKLFNDFIKYAKNISINNFVFSDTNEWKIGTLGESNKKLSTLKLEVSPEFFKTDQIIPREEYIIFHTKCRVDAQFNYDRFTNEAREFFAKFKSKYTIILLGERTFPKTFEGDILKIRTLYNEMLLMHHNNKVIDMTKLEIYNSLDYESFKRDVSLVRGAKYNVCVGLGGHYCTSITFGARIIHYCPFQPPFDIKLLSESDYHYFDKSDAFFKFLGTISEKTNILYLLNHKTLTDYEVPLLIRAGYGVYIAKKLEGVNMILNSFTNTDASYDNYLQLEPEHIRTLNQVKWYTDQPIEESVIKILNRYFKTIIITPLTGPSLLQQLSQHFDGKIIYRLFGMAGKLSYTNILSYTDSPKIQYMFGYDEILDFEKSQGTFFNQSNSLVVPLGLSNKFINQYTNTYNPINHRVCFVCSKFGYCDYYTSIYLTFVNWFSKYPHIILGRDNNINSENLKNNLTDEEFYRELCSSKLLYYHGKEPMHLHYHPLEAIVIGIPIIFHNESLLSTYIGSSPGKCDSIEEVQSKIERILANEEPLIKEIITEQNKSICRLTAAYNKQYFDNI